MGQLTEAASVVLDASGNGSVRLRPANTRTTWKVASVQVTVSSNANEPTANVYMNTPTGADLGGTYTGSNDTCSGLNVELYPGQALAVQWRGGDPGARATATVYGTTATWS